MDAGHEKAQMGVPAQHKASQRGGTFRPTGFTGGGGVEGNTGILLQRRLSMSDLKGAKNEFPSEKVRQRSN